jgi:hypothetical protein
MPTLPTSTALTYRGLYAGVSEIAVLAQTSRQYVAKTLVANTWFPPALGYIYSNPQRWPYWFLCDAADALRSHGRLLVEPVIDADVQDWEYDYRGNLVTADGFARLGGFVNSNVHPVARTRAVVPIADRLRMGTVWREDEVRAALAGAGYPKRAVA